MKIRIRLAYYFPVLNIYYDFKAVHAGICRIVYNKIKKSFWDDKGLLLHEMNHSKQFFRFSRKSWLYHFSKKWKLRSELECYALQILYYKKTKSDYNESYYISCFSEFIRLRYGLDETKDYRLMLLEEVHKYGS